MKINPFTVPLPVDDADADWNDWYINVYLNSNFWRWRREAYIKWVGFHCEATWNNKKCTNPGTQIHHLTYKNLYNERNEDLMLLCRRCHERAHKWSKAANDNGQMALPFDRLNQKKTNST